MKKNNFFWLVSFAMIIFLNNLVGQDEHSDFINPLVICDKSPIFLEQLTGAGTIDDTYLLGELFSDQFIETNSIFIKWKVKKSGLLEFLITPNHPEDDLDFVLFKKTPNLEVLRNMARGQDLGESEQLSDNCKGATGLKAISVETGAINGCYSAIHNFLAPVYLEAGEEYMLMVNNHHSNDGFWLDFHGDVAFENVVECNESASLTPVDEVSSTKILVDPPIPNPTTESVITKITCSGELDGSVGLFDQTGKLISLNQIKLKPGNNNITTSLHNCSRGIYVVTIHTGDIYHSFQVVKN